MEVCFAYIDEAWQSTARDRLTGIKAAMQIGTHTSAVVVRHNVHHLATACVCGLCTDHVIRGRVSFNLTAHVGGNVIAAMTIHIVVATYPISTLDVFALS